MNVILVPVDEGQPVQEKRLEDLPIHIGRHPDVEFRLDDESVSDFHCVLDEINDVLWVRDLGSKEGTFVNGFHVAQSHLLPGDKLTVGMTSFQVRYQRHSATTGEKVFA